jgi:hypothetical protein
MMVKTKYTPPPAPAWSGDGADLVAPVGTCDLEKAWEGRIWPKPAGHKVTATLAHLETPHLLAPCIDLLRLQTEKPYILIVDTGSSLEVCARLEAEIRAPDCEIHYLKSHCYSHSSAPVGVACDLALALCQSEYLFMTHCDAFLRRRDYVAWLIALLELNDAGAVGYEMSPRDWITDQWRGMLSHTASLLHVPTMLRAGASFNFERGHHEFDLPRGDWAWPDTETTWNLVMQRQGVRRLLIGRETNHARHVDVNVDHPRSFASSSIYSESYNAEMAPQMALALNEARERAELWRAEIAAEAAAVKPDALLSTSPRRAD